MSDQSDYCRAAGVNHPDDIHETRKVKALQSGVSRQVKWIEIAEVVFLVVFISLSIAVRNGWL